VILPRVESVREEGYKGRTSIKTWIYWNRPASGKMPTRPSLFLERRPPCPTPQLQY